MPFADLDLARELARRLTACERRDGLLCLPRCVSAPGLTHLSDVIMRDDLVVYPHGEMLLWDVARHEGFNIPPYPLAGCGDAREFLAEYGAEDVPGWYELRGIPRQVSESFYAYGCVMARNTRFWRRIWAVPAPELEDPNLLAAHLLRGLSFALGTQEGDSDPRLFRC